MKKEEDFNPLDGGYGWVIVVSVVLINFTLLPLIQCFGIIFQNDFEDMGLTAAEISFLLHLQNSMMCCFGLLGSPLSKKYAYKEVALFGTFLTSLGIFLTTFARSYAVLLFTVSILTGIGQGILLPALYLATNSYFKKRLTLAVSFSVTGASLSPIFMPQICTILLDLYGTKYTILTLFAISLNAFAGCLLLRPAKRRKSKPCHQISGDENGDANEVSERLITSNGIYKETTVPKIEETILSKLSAIFDLELLKERPYVVVIVGLGVSFVAELNIVLMMQFLLVELADFSRKEVGNFMSVHYSADVLGRLMVPVVAHRVGWSPKIMYAGSLIGSSIGRTGLAIFCDTKVVLIYVISIILGICKGSKAVFQSTIIPQYVSLDKIPTATGLSMALNGILSLIIGPFIGLVHDMSSSYEHALHVASALSLSCVVLWAVEALIETKDKPEVAAKPEGAN